jgi:1,4-alpha-glucan branching enzyme
LWLLAGLAVLALAAAAGCDRTRPYVPPGAEAPAGGKSAAATPAAPAAAAEAPVKTPDGWRFSYSDPSANSVALAGTFNNWSTSSDPLKKGDNGVWTIVKPLDPGTYQYKFVVNGSDWKPDPENPNSADDGYGGKNSTLTVS